MSRGSTPGMASPLLTTDKPVLCSNYTHVISAVQPVHCSALDSLGAGVASLNAEVTHWRSARHRHGHRHLRGIDLPFQPVLPFPQLGNLYRPMAQK